MLCLHFWCLQRTEKNDPVHAEFRRVEQIPQHSFASANKLPRTCLKIPSEKIKYQFEYLVQEGNYVCFGSSPEVYQPTNQTTESS